MLSSGPLAPRAEAEESTGRDALRQVAGVLDYIAGDYRVAVDARGQVIHEGEYQEQLELAQNAQALAASAGLAEDDPVRRALDELLEALRAKAAPKAVAERCRSAREQLIRSHGLTLAPRTPPDYQRGAELYASQGCPRCHGADGGANTEAARNLEPPPADFLSAERMATVSPHRAFYAITFGVEGTAMPAAAQLSDAERWSLAFYVLSLRHPRHLVDEGREVVAQTSLQDDAKALARVTDEQLREALREEVPSPGDRAAAMAYLRAGAPFGQAPPAARFRVARQKLEEGLRAYQRGDASEARRHFVAAYLDGFEPHEASLQARDSELVRQIERQMLALRESVSEGKPTEQVAAGTRDVIGLLNRASQEGDEAGRGHTAFLGALAITLREGLEIALLVGALLGLVRSRGRPEQARWVHAGWLLAIPAGLLTWLLAGEVLSGLHREVAEGLVAITASIVLLGVTHWLLGQLSAKRWMGFLARKAQDATASRRGSAFAVLALAFVAAYREAFEMVLFFKALLLDAASTAHLVWLGAAAGVAVLVLVTLVLRLIGKRLKPRPFMIFSSVLLAALSVVLLGKGVRALQEAGWIATTELALPDVPTVGFHGTAQGLLAQGILLALLLASALWSWRSGRSAERHSEAAA